MIIATLRWKMGNLAVVHDMLSNVLSLSSNFPPYMLSLQQAYEQGARFAKWRNVLHCCTWTQRRGCLATLPGCWGDRAGNTTWNFSNDTIYRHLSIYLPIYLSTYLYTYIHVFVYLFICLFMYLFTTMICDAHQNLAFSWN